MKPWSTLLCDDEELSFLKRAFESINESTRILKQANDEVRPTPAFRNGKPIKREFEFYS